MPGALTDDEALLFARLLRRAHIIVEHHRYHGQEIDPRDIAERALRGQGPTGDAPLGRYRQPLEEAVSALVHGLR